MSSQISETLHSYNEAVECYQQVHTMLQQGEPLAQEQVLLYLQACATKLETVIHSEDNYIKYIMQLCQLRLKLQESIEHIQQKPNKIKVAEKNVFTTNKLVETKLSTSQSKDIMAYIQVLPKVDGFKELAGLDDIKEMLITFVILPIKQPQLYFNQKLTKSLLLFGPPGTGKTLIAHALAAEIKATLFSMTPGNVLSSYCGESEKTIQNIFKYLAQAEERCVLFIDEIDGFCRTRNETESEHSRRLKTELMCQLSNFEDSKNAYIICATNCPWDLDVAFLRRFQQRIYVPLPDRATRYDLFQHYTKDTPLLNITNSEILNKTEGYSSSDIKDLIRNALQKPIHELVKNTLWKSLCENQYEPADYFESNLIYCTLDQLPEGSAKCRDPNLSDLEAAIQSTMPTVSQENIQKYTAYVQLKE